MKKAKLDRCRVCGSSKVRKLYNLKDKFDIYNCSNCQTDLLYPLPSIKDVSQSTDYEYFKAYEDLSIKLFKTEDFKRILDQLPKSRVKSALDVGCANAYLVESMLKDGIDAYGIELFPEVAKKAQQKFKEKRIFTGEFTKYNFKRKFDLIVMFDLIEHMVNPYLAFEKAKDLLNKGGFVLILTPDISALKKRLLGRYWTGYYIEHVHCFSPTTMSYFARKSGLKIYKIKRFYKRVNLHYFIRHLFHRYPLFKFLNFFTRFKMLNFIFPINDDSMLAILRKNA